LQIFDIQLPDTFSYSRIVCAYLAVAVLPCHHGAYRQREGASIASLKDYLTKPVRGAYLVLAGLFLAPRPDYLLLKPERRVCWIFCGLLFYALFTRDLLRDIAILGQEDRSFFSAWIALGDWIWRDPGSIAPLSKEKTFEGSMTSAFVSAAIGSLPLLILAIGRRRRLLGLILLLCIPLAWVMAVFVQIGIGTDSFDHPLLFRPDASFIAYARLEQFLGFTAPLFGYPILFCVVLFYLLRSFLPRKKVRPVEPPRPNQN
jgi:hypothetical protein